MGRARLIDVLTQHELWDEYLAFAEAGVPEGDETPDAEGAAACATSASRTPRKGKPEAARRAGRRSCEAMAAKASAAGAQGAMRPLAKAKAPEPRRGSEGGRQKLAGPGAEGGRARPRVSRRLEAGDFKEAVAQFEKAGDVPKEHLSQAYLAAGDKAKAEQLAGRRSTSDRDQCLPLANQVDVLLRCGKKRARRRRRSSKLRKLSSKIDLDVPVYARLAPVAKELGYPADWRLPRRLPGDVLPRPELDTLGPFRWQPSPAPQWSLRGGGRTGRLPLRLPRPAGAGDLLPRPRLPALRRAAQRLRAGGGGLPPGRRLDRRRQHRRARRAGAVLQRRSSDPAGFPFPLVSDEPLSVFKAYRAYDDFEKKPLHGMFLIDGAGPGPLAGHQPRAVQGHEVPAGGGEATAGACRRAGLCRPAPGAAGTARPVRRDRHVLDARLQGV